MATSQPKKQKKQPKTRGIEQEHLKIKGNPKGAEDRHHGKRPTSERPPAPRVQPKRRER